YYNKIIDDLLKNGVTPIVAIYHFDLPQALEDQGGWLSEAIVEVFDKYAQFCFRTFGDRVKQWLTINEPNTLAILAYDMGIFAPGVPHFGTGGYQAAHNLIKAHARSWHSYDDLFRKEQKGFVSLPLFFCWLEPSDPNSVLDQEATKRAINFQLDFFAKPIFIDGDYPELVKSQIATMSKKQGYSSSRLPEFTEEEKKMIKGTADFFAVQYYTTRLVRHQENKKGELSFLQDVEIEFFPNPSWENVGWIYVVPWGIRKLLKYIKDTYNNPVIYITENGFPQCDPPSLDDTQRWEYFRQTFQELFKAKTIDLKAEIHVN
ncbi:Cytosolic beta-glucosidase, partial [Cricetulus griseus]